MPRLVDAFAAVHPFSNGFTCGAKDNSFTFSTQPLHMERRAALPPPPPSSSAADASGSDGAGAALPREELVGETLQPGTSTTPAKQRRPDAGSAPSSGDRGGAQSSAQRRRRFNSSPHDPSLQPSDASLRASRSYGEHVLLLASTQVNADSDAASSTCAMAEPTDSADSASSHATGIADATAAHARSPLAWVDDESPKRIDYVMTSAPLQPVRCCCQWDLMQLPFQTLASDDAAVTAAAASCSCAQQLARLESPGALWKVVSASVFKHYVLEADGRMSSVSDHHGVSVTLQLQFKDAPAAAAVPLPQQHSSTVIISQHTPGATDAAAAAAPDSIETIVSPRLALRKRKLVRGGRDVGDEAELFTLDECGVAVPAPRSASSRSSSPFLTDADEQRSGSGSGSADSAPRLPTSTLLLLASGVLWMGLRDATDRRSAHLLRMGRAFAVFAIGSRSLWLFLLNMYFESIMVELVLPRWMLELTVPTAIAACFRLFFAVIDLAHTFLPIYIVVEYLLTTFPAKVRAMDRDPTLNTAGRGVRVGAFGRPSFFTIVPRRLLSLTYSCVLVHWRSVAVVVAVVVDLCVCLLCDLFVCRRSRARCARPSARWRRCDDLHWRVSDDKHKSQRQRRQRQQQQQHSRSWIDRERRRPAQSHHYRCMRLSFQYCWSAAQWTIKCGCNPSSCDDSFIIRWRRATATASVVQSRERVSSGL